MPLSWLDSYQSVGEYLPSLQGGLLKDGARNFLRPWYLGVEPVEIESHKTTAFAFTAGVTSDLTKNVGLK
jgi:opacity protein-like surface antigen